MITTANNPDSCEKLSDKTKTPNTDAKANTFSK